MADEAPAARMTDDEVAALVASMERTALRRRALIRDAAGPPAEEQVLDGLPLPVHVAEQLDRFRASLNPVMGLELHDIVAHRVVDGLDLGIGALLEHPLRPTPRDLLHVYGPDRDGSGDPFHYRYSWLDHSQFGQPFTTAGSAIVRFGRLSGACGVYGGQWAYSLGGAGMLFTPKHGSASVSVRPAIPWLALTSFNPYAVGASVRCQLGVLVQSWWPGETEALVDRDVTVTVLHRTSAEGHLLDDETGGTSGSADGVSTDFIAAAGRRYAIYVYAWLEADGGRRREDGPLAYTRIELDATVPFVVVEETLP